ncbi:MAG: DUF433 domain-containing protein [Defluviicoccus sp.]|nr:DUF433 domain-containing protein [Defluviicoccus sp.]MDE0276609.1 DUF433 domain-containing protein [Defluviicoccus sp.]
MSGNTLIFNRDEALANIPRYRDALKDVRHGAALRKLMPMAHAWYAAKPRGEQWLFAPSKFIGYAGNTAEAYFRDRSARRGRDTERILRQWFHVVRPGSRLGDAVEGALRDFFRSYGHPGPRKGARICVPAEVLDDVAKAPEASDRIAVDPAICGGRPHIRGTRVRVSDILRLMASGAATRQILADYPYLKDADVRAALACAAAAVDHRVVTAG